MDPLKLYFLLTMVFPIDNGDITVSLLEDTCIRICFFRENMSKMFAPGMQSAVSCCRTSWGQGRNSRWNSKALSSQICHMSGVFCDTCKSISSFFVEVFMMVRWVLNICLDEFYWTHLCKEEARPQSHAAVQAEEVGEGDELKTTPRETVLIRPATHTVCLFVSSCRCQDMHAAFVSFCTVQLKWFCQLNFDSKHTLSAPGMQSAVSCCRTSWGQGGNSHWNSKACHDRYVICQACFVIHANLFLLFSSKFLWWSDEFWIYA